MCDRRGSARSEDPAVGPVESLLDRAATFRELRHALPSDEPLVTTHALWICACVTLADAPTWLIYDDGDGGLAWCRVPDGIDILDLVARDSVVGGHADPGEVLSWLRGQASDPWAGGGAGPPRRELEHFGRALRRP